ncbi:DUF6456 domain-containing protein [Pseudooceanicola sp. MF1-13]|uniref:DUF6456 domain-containing protein n=1 Tax=Pseudooceanicola sp. MF1-13 TaxID=3379095 RepID=UPI0038921740
MTQHVQNWNDSWPEWVPEQVRRYIAHTEGGAPIRILAKAEGCHASTVMRQIRQVESAREDALYDEGLRWLGQNTEVIDLGTGEDVLPGFKLSETVHDVPTLEKEAIPALRRLSKPGAVMAIAAEMDRAVIVKNGEGGETHRLGVVERRIAQTLALNEWISCIQPGRLSRYRITNLGRTELNAMMAKLDNLANGFAETPSQFLGQTKRKSAAVKRSRMGLIETPIMSLARRRDTRGRPFLTPAQVRAAERIQDDFELAQMEPRTTTNWNDYLTAGTSGPGLSEGGLRGASAARARVSAALRELGPGLGDVVLECCCRLEGLETAEKKLGWSARSGKIVLRIALQRLRQHYDNLSDGGGLIG